MMEDKYYKYMPMTRGYSNCCGGTVWENQDICNTCGEHCDVIDTDDCDLKLNDYENK